MTPQPFLPDMPHDKEPIENYTLGDLLHDLQQLNPQQLTQQMRYLGEHSEGKAKLWVLQENHINPYDEELTPLSQFRPLAGEEFDGERHLTEAEIEAEEMWPAGLVLIVAA